MVKKVSMMQRIICIMVALVMALACFEDYAVAAITKTNISTTVTATGSYQNWEGVSTVSQFKDKNGKFIKSVGDNGSSSLESYYTMCVQFTFVWTKSNQLQKRFCYNK